MMSDMNSSIAMAFLVVMGGGGIMIVGLIMWLVERFSQ